MPGSVHPWKWLEKPSQRLHVDYCSPLSGIICLLIIDTHSKWIDVHPVVQATVGSMVA